MRNTQGPLNRILLALACSAVMESCQSGPPITEGYPHQTALQGKSRSDVLTCAGIPRREMVEGDVTLLRYYREAPILEESVVASKGSHAGVHHGCWATVVIRNDRVEQVHYRFAPSFFDASNDCEDIFAACFP